MSRTTSEVGNSTSVQARSHEDVTEEKTFGGNRPEARESVRYHLAASFIRLVRDAAARDRSPRKDGRSRGAGSSCTTGWGLLGSSVTDGGRTGPNGSDDTAAEQLPLWDALPPAWRDDHPMGLLSTLLESGQPDPFGLKSRDNSGADPFDPFVPPAQSDDPMVDLQAHWRATVAGPIPIASFDWTENDPASRDDRTTRNDAPRDDVGPTHAGLNGAGSALGDTSSKVVTPAGAADDNGLVPSDGVGTAARISTVSPFLHRAPSPGTLAARRHRIEDPSRLSTMAATTGAMLGAALAGRDEVAAALVYGAPVVIVRAPVGLDSSALTDCIERCLTQWPIASGEAGGSAQADGPNTLVMDASADDEDDLDDVFGDRGTDRLGRSSWHSVREGRRPRNGANTTDAAFTRRLALIDVRIARSGDRNKSGRKKANDSYLSTVVSLQAKGNTAIILAAPGTELSAELIALAEYELALCLPDPAILRLVAEAVTAEPSPPLPRQLWNEGDDGVVDPTTGPTGPNDTSRPSTTAKFTIDDLRAALSPIRGARGSIDRLVRLVDARAARSDVGIAAGSENAPPLEQLAGYGKAKADGLAIAADLQAYRLGTIGWASVARGLVLAGPPGTGKSLFARSLAKSAGVPLVVGSMADWQAHHEGHLGDMLSAMRSSFEHARTKAPCILFIDELDSVGDRRNFPERHRDYSTQVVNGLLQQLDGAVGREGVVVIGATNNPGAIDPAVLRPGRLERIVSIGLPDVADLIAMLRVHLADVPVADGDPTGKTHPTAADLGDDALRPVALALRGRTGADVASVVRRARGVARRADRALGVDDLLAIAREGRGPDLPPAVAHRISIHEAGHAVVAMALGVGDIHSLSLDVDGGLVHVRPQVTEQTREDVEAEIAFTLGGRAAEIELLGTPSAGAGGSANSDLASATLSATQLHNCYGLGQTLTWRGPVTDDASLSWAARDPTVRDDVERTLVAAHERAMVIIRKERAGVERIADRLQRDGYVEGEEVLQLR